MSVHEHHFLDPTLHPDFRRCSRSGCPEVARVAQPRPAPAQEHSPTSVAAARSAATQKTRLMVWQAFLAAGEVGMTDEECQTATGLEGSSQRPRRVELVADGLVFDSGATRPTRSGRAACVWQARPPR